MSTPWFFNIDQASPSSPAWMAYSAADALKIEKAHAKKNKTCTLNDTYKIDLLLMRQVRRDDASRWRAIKRGGTEKDPPPKGPDDGAAAAPDASDKEEEEEAKKPAAAGRAPSKAKAAAAAAADAADVAAPAWSMPAAAAAPAPAAAAATASPPVASTSLVEAKLRTDLDSLRQQLADVETEQDAALAKHRADMAAATAAHERQMAAAEAAHKKELAEAKVEAQAAHQKEMAGSEAAHEAALAKAAAAHAAALSEARDATKRAEALLRTAKEDVARLKDDVARLRADCAARDSQLAASQASLAALRSETAPLRNQYAQVLNALKPIAAAFGIAPHTVIGRALVEFEKSGGGAAAAAAGSVTAAAASEDHEAPASPVAPSAKKRARSPAQEEDAATQAMAPMEEEETAAPSAKKARGAAAARPAAAAAAATMDDDDATQPMVAPDEDMRAVDEDEAPSAAAAAAAARPALKKGAPVAPAAAAASASAAVVVPAPFLPNAAALEGLLLTKPSDPAPLCVASLPFYSPALASDPSQGVHLALVGCRGGHIALWQLAPSRGGTSKSWPLDVTRGVHKFGGRSSAAPPPAGVDEDYSQGAHVHAIVALPVAPGHFVVLTGEGRLLRAYALSLEVSAAKGLRGQMKFVSETDVGVGSWVTCMAQVRDPSASPAAAAAAATGKGAKSFVAVGVSGAAHSIHLYAVPTGGVGPGAAAAKPVLQRSFPTRSEEVRGVAQLPSSGRLVAAGCSVAVEGDLNEGGSVELWDWDAAAGAEGAMLQHDVRVHQTVGLRCNAIQLVSGAPGAGVGVGARAGAAAAASGVDHLVAAYEYCSNGARQLVLYSFDRSGTDVSATNLENKHSPPAEQVTFTGLAASSRHPQRLAAITYGGVLLLYDPFRGAAVGASCKAMLAALPAHGDASTEDATFVFVVQGTGADAAAATPAPVLLTCGGSSQLKLWREK